MVGVPNLRGSPPNYRYRFYGGPFPLLKKYFFLSVTSSIYALVSVSHCERIINDVVSIDKINNILPLLILTPFDHPKRNYP